MVRAAEAEVASRWNEEADEATRSSAEEVLPRSLAATGVQDNIEAARSRGDE